MKTLFLSLLQPQCGGRVGGSRSPPPKHRFSRFVFVGKRPRPLVGRAPSPGGPGPKPPTDLAQRPLGPGPPLSPASQIFNFLLRLKFMGPGLKTLGCYHNPQSADLGGRWMVSEGGALQSHARRGSRLRSSISGWAKPLGTWPTSP